MKERTCSQITPEDEKKLDKSLDKTRGGMLGRIGTLFQANEITEELWLELEELLKQVEKSGSKTK